MDVFSDPQIRLMLYYAGAAILFVLILMTIIFYALRIRKIRHLAKKNPEQMQRYNAFLLFLNYIIYSLLVFISSALIAGVPLVAAIYGGIWLSQNAVPLLPLLAGGACVGIFFGFYVTFKFLRAKVAYEESKMLPTANELI